MIAFINNNKVELLKDNYSYDRVIGNNDSVFCAINPSQSLVAIGRKSGAVELYKTNGSYVRSIGKNDAVNVAWSGNDIVITRKSGRPELYKENGSYIRSL